MRPPAMETRQAWQGGRGLLQRLQASTQPLGRANGSSLTPRQNADQVTLWSPANSAPVITMKTINYTSCTAPAPRSFGSRPSDFTRRQAHDDSMIRREARRTQETCIDAMRHVVTRKRPRHGPTHAANSPALEAFHAVAILGSLKQGRTRLFGSRFLQRGGSCEN